MENSRKAAKDFGGIPIVVVDIDKCLEAERKKLDNLIDEYKIDGDMAKLEQISHIIKNNRHTRNDFAMDIDLEAIEKKLESNKTKKTVSVSRLRKIYNNIKDYIKAQFSYSKSKEVLSEEK